MKPELDEPVLIPCECSSVDHVLVIWLDRETGDLSVRSQMNLYHPWWWRTWLAVRYVFGHGRSRFGYGHWDSTLVRVEDHARIKVLLDESAEARAREDARLAANVEELRRAGAISDAELERTARGGA